MGQRRVNRPDGDALAGASAQEVARTLGRIAVEAGRLLASLAERARGHRTKDDGSPTTEADLQAEALIVARLAAAFPHVPVVAEEAGAEAHPEGLFFLVDPLDGTRDYLTGTGEYAVCIALVSGSRPTAAAVAAPDAGRVWVAGETAEVANIPAADDGADLDWRPARTRPIPPDGMVALVSRRHGDEATEACLAALPIGERRTCSSAYKFCLIASGEADLYVRCGPTMEWDTAAGDHVLVRAGGTVLGEDGEPLAYGRTAAGYRNGPFVALGDPSWGGRVRLRQS